MPQIVLSEVAQRAHDLLAPVVNRAMETGVAKRHHGQLIVSRRVDGRRKRNQDAPRLFEYAWGLKNEWEYPYDEIAESKTRITVVIGEPSRCVSEEKRQQIGGFPYWGSWISWVDPEEEVEIVAAFSGVDPEIDELFCRLLIETMRSLIELDIKRAREAGDDSAVEYINSLD